MGTDTISKIGIQLRLDTSQLSSDAARADKVLAGIGKNAGSARVGSTTPSRASGAQQAQGALVPGMMISRAVAQGLHAQLNDHFKAMGAAGQGVVVPVKLARTNWSALRAEISAGIGTIPISVSIKGGLALKGGGNNAVLAAVLADTSGQSLGQAKQSVTRSAIRQGVPLKGTGGMVASHQPIIVGDQGREVFVPNQSGRLLSRQQDQQRRIELERRWQSERENSRVDYPSGGGYHRGGMVHARQGMFVKADAEAFASAISAARAQERHGRRIGETVYQYPTDEYQKMRTFLTRDRSSGYAIKPDGDLVSVFNAGRSGQGQSALRSAIHRGGTKLDAFDESGFLPGLYSKFGFREVGRDPWNPDYAPAEWRGGTPDVVYMQRLGKRIREGRARGGHVLRKNPKVNRQVLYALRWPEHAANRHYDNMAEEARFDRYRPDDEFGNDREYGHGSSLGEPRLWLGGLPHRWMGGWAHREMGGVAGRMTEGQLDFLGNMRAVAKRITPEELQFGRVWYADAQDYIKEQAARFGMDEKTVRGVTAALSAGTSWVANKTKLERVLEAHTSQGLFGGGGFPYSMGLDAHRKAAAILGGMDPEEAFATSPKVSQFYRNLGGDLDAVTLDRWAFRSATQGALSQYGKGPLRAQIDAAFRQVAAEAGLHPVEFQAAAWLNERNVNPPSVGSHSRGAAAGQMHMAGGGWGSMGPYIVGEAGPEMFVPARMQGMIPRNVMDRIPKRGSGGPVMIGQQPNSLFAPPEDGWIIPHHLLGKMEHRAPGGPVSSYERVGTQGGSQTVYVDPSTRKFISYAKAAEMQAQLAQEDQARSSARVIEDQATAALDANLAKARAFRLKIADEATSRGTDPATLAYREQSAELTTEGKAKRGLRPSSFLGGLALFGLGGGEQRSEARAQFSQLSATYRGLTPKGIDAVEQFSEQLHIARTGYIGATHELAKMKDTVGTTDAQLDKQQKIVTAFGDAVDISKTQLDHATDLQTRRDEAFQRSQGGVAQSFAAIQLAGLSYTIGLKAASFALGALSDAAKPAIDTITGFGATATRVTQSIAQTLPSVGGQTSVAFAQQGIQSGLSGQAIQYLQSVLGPSVQAKGAAIAQGNASDLFRAAAGVGGAPTGLTGGYGGLLGTSLFAQQLGGGKGYEEQIAGDISSIGIPTQGGQGQPVPGIRGGGPNPSGRPLGTPTAAPAFQHLDVVTEELRSVTAAAQRYAQATGSKDTVELKFFDSGAKYADEQSKAIAAAQAAGDTYAEQNAKSGVGFFINGKVASSAAQLNQALQASAAGTNIPSQQVVTQGLQPQLAAGVAQQAAQTAFAIGGPGSGSGNAGLIGGAVGLQLAAQPFAAATSGIAKGFQPSIVNLKDIQTQQDALTQQGQQAVRDMTQLVSDNAGPAAAAQFTSYVAGITSLGKEITSISSQLANQSAAVGAAQYANNLRILNRSISDARGLVTGRGATSGPSANLGAIERLQFTLQQAAEQLSIAASQRQINFSVAAAGFQAPGLSGEERAARIAEAKYEASIAQKQLNIQKQQVPLARTAFDISAGRSLVDLEHQKQINAQEYALSQEQVADQKKINALTLAMSIKQQQAQKVLDNAVGNWNSALSIAAQAAGQYGYELNSILGDIRKGIDIALGIPTGGGGGGGPKAAANGILGDTSGPTTITVGEVAGEHVAVLKNPRRMSLPAGASASPSTTLQFVITGNSIREEADIDTLVRKVVSQVEAAIQKRGALLGLRALGG